MAARDDAVSAVSLAEKNAEISRQITTARTVSQSREGCNVGRAVFVPMASLVNLIKLHLTIDTVSGECESIIINGRDVALIPRSCQILYLFFYDCILSSPTDDYWDSRIVKDFVAFLPRDLKRFHFYNEGAMSLEVSELRHLPPALLELTTPIVAVNISNLHVTSTNNWHGMRSEKYVGHFRGRCKI